MLQVLGLVACSKLVAMRSYQCLPRQQPNVVHNFAYAFHDLSCFPTPFVVSEHLSPNKIFRAICSFLRTVLQIELFFLLRVFIFVVL